MANPKLVRDRIPEIICAEGRTPRIHTASPSEYREMLTKKLREEVDEFIADENLEEMADIVEVLNAICAEKGWGSEELIAIRRKKATERGGFSGRIILEES